MKNVFRVLGIIALVAVIGFFFAACDDGNDPGGGGGTTTYSLDGIWRAQRGVDDHIVTISDSTGVITQISSLAIWQSAINKGYIKAGDQKFRDLRNTGGLTWTGEERTVWFNTNAPNVATEVTWKSCTITLAANGLSFTSYSPEVGSITYTKTTLTLDGNWQAGRDVFDHVVTISGSTGVLIQISSLPVWQSAINKGFIKVGDQKFKDLRNTGGSTWTGEERTVWFNTNAPNVATEVTWKSCTITLAANGLSFTSYSPEVGSITYYRR